MNFNKDDQIEYLSNIVKHESAGGVVFFEDPITHELFVALLRDTDGRYVIPKGHLKKNETPEIAAIREVKEELSLTDDPEVVSFIGINNYTFTLNDSEAVHKKNVYIYVFYIDKKVTIKPLNKEGYKAAEWISFETALEKISFDRENLLQARQSFYYNKPVKIYDDLSDITSVTIVVPTHNGGKTIKNTLFSIEERMKEIPHFIQKEVIICTDHCTDDTKTVVKDFVNNYNNSKIKIKLIDNNGLKGKAIALNKLFSNSLGEIFCTIDDDVILEKGCLMSLLKEVVSNSDLRCVFSVWKRLPFKGGNPYKLFWHWVLGVKFDIQPYDKPQEFMRGACMMFRRDNFVLLPSILNEDQFIQYIYWPKVREVQSSVLYFNSVSDIFDYYKRSLRIMVGSKQLSKYFTRKRIRECNEALSRKLNYKKIMNLPWKQKIPFLLYIFIKLILNIYKKVKLRFIKDYEYFRFKQN